MSSCLSGGGRAFRLGHEMMESPSSSWVSNSSFTDSSNSSVSVRKARTPRKRPNQIYEEAAAILSSACPKIFPASPSSFTKSIKNHIPFDSELFTPFRSIGVGRLRFSKEGFIEKQCRSPEEISSHGYYADACYELGKDFGDESILDDGAEESIDSIMGKLSMENKSCGSSFSTFFDSTNSSLVLGDGIRNGLRVMRNAREEDDWWKFPTVEAAHIKLDRAFKAPKEKKKKVPRKDSTPSSCNNRLKESSWVRKSTSKNPPKSIAGLLLRLNYESVVDSWGEKASPFLGDEKHTRLAKIDLFSAVGEESKVKGQSKKNYPVKQRLRKVNATDQRRRPQRHVL